MWFKSFKTVNFLNKKQNKVQTEQENKNCQNKTKSKCTIKCNTGYNVERMLSIHKHLWQLTKL